MSETTPGREAFEAAPSGFLGFMASQGYDDQDRFDQDEMELAFEAGWTEALAHERDSLTGRAAGLVSEGNQLRGLAECYRRALECIAKDSEGYDPGTNEHAHHSMAVAALASGSPDGGGGRDET